MSYCKAVFFTDITTVQSRKSILHIKTLFSHYHYSPSGTVLPLSVAAMGSAFQQRADKQDDEWWLIFSCVIVLSYAIVGKVLI